MILFSLQEYCSLNKVCLSKDLCIYNNNQNKINIINTSILGGCPTGYSRCSENANDTRCWKIDCEFCHCSKLENNCSNQCMPSNFTVFMEKCGSGVEVNAILPDRLHMLLQMINRFSNQPTLVFSTQVKTIFPAIFISFIDPHNQLLLILINIKTQKWVGCSTYWLLGQLYRLSLKI